MRRHGLKRLLLALLVPGLCLTLLTPAWAAPQPVSRAFLGIAVAPVAKDASQQGAVVREVTPDSPAAKAGLKDGDLIIRIDDKDVKAPEAVVNGIQAHKAGEKAKLQVLRDGNEQTFEITLGERQVESLVPMPEFFPAKRTTFLGVMSHELTAEMKKDLGVKADKGAVVSEVMPGTPAAQAGLKKDDVITEVNGQAVANPEELRSAIQKLEPGKEATLKVLHGSETREVKVTLQAGPIGFDWPKDFGKDWPMLKDGKFSFEKLPGFNHPELERMLQDMHKRMQGLDEKEANPSK